MEQEADCICEVQDSETDPVADENFCFETDDPVLKTNPDYQKLLKALCILETQRMHLVKKVDALHDVNKLLDSNPNIVVEKIFSGEFDVLLSPVNTVEVDTSVDWSKYNMIEDEHGNVQVNDNVLQPQTRLKKKEPSTCVDNEDLDLNDKILVRGREFDESKPETFNQLWTEEEQARLEELLVEYPPERIENRRWAKIAKALGNRTPRQVCSRVQKYFLKLHKAGLVVPGRPPRSYAKKKIGKLKKNLHTRTTFFPKLSKEQKLKVDNKIDTNVCNDNNSNNSDEINNGFNCKLFNSEKGDGDVSLDWDFGGSMDFTGVIDNSVNSSDNIKNELSNHNFNISSYLLESDKMKNSKIKNSNADSDIWLNDKRKLEILKKIRESLLSPLGSYRHFHFKCLVCEDQPIVGMRWHCVTCDVNFCSDCMITLLDDDEDNRHPGNHIFRSAGVLDDEDRDYDYYPAKFESTNHLDPNYIP